MGTFLASSYTFLLVCVGATNECTQLDLWLNRTSTLPPSLLFPVGPWCASGAHSPRLNPLSSGWYPLCGLCLSKRQDHHLSHGQDRQWQLPHYPRSGQLWGQILWHRTRWLFRHSQTVRGLRTRNIFYWHITIFMIVLIFFFSIFNVLFLEGKYCLALFPVMRGSLGTRLSNLKRSYLTIFFLCITQVHTLCTGLQAGLALQILQCWVH